MMELGGGAVTSRTPEECGLGFGRCVELDGVSSYIQVTDPVSLRVQTHTVAFWIKFKEISPGEWRPILYKTTLSGNRAPGIWRHKDSPNRLHWRYNPGNTGFDGVGPKGEGTDFDINKWYHVVGVKKDTSLKLYVDGKSVASTGVPDPIDQGPGDFFIGSIIGSNPAVILDEVQIYNQALTLSQIQRLYAQGLIKQILALR